MTVRILQGDCRNVLASLPAESVHCCVTSPPYFGLRDYGVDGQIGLEPTPDDFVTTMVDVFREVRRVLRKDGTLWLNLGDSYASKPAGSNGFHDGRANREERTSTGVPPGCKPKDLIGIPWRVAFALQADGWWLRSNIIWHKPNPMPESVTDRPTSAHEHIFLLAKSERYYYDHDAVKEPALQPVGVEKKTGQGKKDALRAAGTTQNKNGTSTSILGSNQGSPWRNPRNVWIVPTEPYSDAHFATFPPALIEPCIKAGCPAGGTVLDPFGGAGTTGLVADRLGRDAVLIELNPEYAAMARRRIEGDAGMFASIRLEAAE